MIESVFDTQMAVAPLMICLLGRFRILQLGRPVPFRGDSKVASLFRCLAFSQSQGLSRESLLELLWPGSARDLAAQSLNTLVYEARRTFGRALDGQAPLLYEQSCYRLNTEAGVAVDIRVLDGLVDKADHLAAADRFEEARPLYESVLVLYEGDLCCYDDVDAIIERERVRIQHREVLIKLARRHHQQGDFDMCLHYAMRLLKSDPCREDAHRLAMQCYMGKGIRAQALRQYHLCCEVLRAEYDTGPEPATIRLYEEARAAARAAG